MNSTARTLNPRIIVLIAVVGAMSACSEASSGFREIRKAIEDAWNSSCVGLVIGDVKFVEYPDLSKGEDQLSELPWYEALAKEKFIVLSDKRRTGRWIGATYVRGTARITVTNKGRTNGEIKKIGKTSVLFLLLGTSKIEDIVANELLTVGADRYRVVMGTHTFDLSKAMRAAYLEVTQDSLGRERRFKAFLKYDPFEKKWACLRTDIGPRKGEFLTESVDGALGSLRLCGSLSC